MSFGEWLSIIAGSELGSDLTAMSEYVIWDKAIYKSYCLNG